MKRKLALLLTLSLALAGVPGSGVMAAGPAAEYVTSEESIESTESKSGSEAESNDEDAIPAEAAGEEDLQQKTAPYEVQDTEVSGDQDDPETEVAGNPQEDSKPETSGNAQEDPKPEASDNAQEDPEQEIAGNAQEDPESETSDSNHDAPESRTDEAASDETIQNEEEQSEEKPAEEMLNVTESETAAAESSEAGVPQIMTAKAQTNDSKEVEIRAAQTKASAQGADTALNGFVTRDGKHYFYKNGVQKTGWVKFKNATYYIKPNGEMAVGLIHIKGKGTFYFMDPSYAAYKASKEGQMMTGFKTIKGNRYYFADHRYKKLPTGARATGWRTINGKKYYFVSSNYPYSKVKGKMLTGIKTISGKTYYFNRKGVRLTGWVKMAGNRLAYYTSSGAAGKAGWKSKDGDWYYLAKNGKAKVGWIKLDDDAYYYLDKNNYGRMMDAPASVNGKLYFFDADGRRAVTEGWKTYGEDFYYTYKNGRVAVNTTIDGIDVDSSGKAELSEMDRKAQDYDSSTNYLILVNKSLHKVCIYRWDNGFWHRIRSCYCGDGKPSTPTVEGDFSVGIKMLYFDSGSARCWYATQFYGNYLFHSVLYYQDFSPRYVMDGRVGVGVSHGCVRMEIDNAHWIYNNIPRGTKVVVYR